MQKIEIKDHDYSLLPKGKKWKLIFSDEFDGAELDRSKWDFRLNFWGKRFETYTDEGVTVKDSLLKINLIEKDGQYYSAQLQTGSNSFDIPKDESNQGFWPLGRLPEPKFMHSFGYYEIKCKFQKEDGWWSAFWLQSPSIGTTYDPKYSGIECDIMECFEPNHTDGIRVTSGNIYGGYADCCRGDGRIYYNIEPTEDGFHRFGVHWSKDGYVFYCDGKETSRTDGRYVSHVEQFILLTTECKGYREGDGKTPDQKLLEAKLPDCFTVDYVRVFDEIEE